MKQRSVEIVSDYLGHRPIGRIVGVRGLANPDQFSVSVEDRRDGRTHVFLTTDHIETWLRSFRQGRCLQAGWATATAAATSTATAPKTASSTSCVPTADRLSSAVACGCAASGSRP